MQIYAPKCLSIGYWKRMFRIKSINKEKIFFMHSVKLNHTSSSEGRPKSNFNQAPRPSSDSSKSISFRSL